MAGIRDVVLENEKEKVPMIKVKRVGNFNWVARGTRKRTTHWSTEKDSTQSIHSVCHHQNILHDAIYCKSTSSSWNKKIEFIIFSFIALKILHIKDRIGELYTVLVDCIGTVFYFNDEKFIC